MFPIGKLILKEIKKKKNVNILLFSIIKVQV